MGTPQAPSQQRRLNRVDHGTVPSPIPWLRLNCRYATEGIFIDLYTLKGTTRIMMPLRGLFSRLSIWRKNLGSESTVSRVPDQAESRNEAENSESMLVHNPRMPNSLWKIRYIEHLQDPRRSPLARLRFDPIQYVCESYGPYLHVET